MFFLLLLLGQMVPDVENAMTGDYYLLKWAVKKPVSITNTITITVIIYHHRVINITHNLQVQRNIIY